MTMRTGWLCVILSGCLVLGVAGCQSTDSKRDTTPKSLDVMDGKSFRPAAAKHENYFFNDKADEIERSLGM